MDWFCSLRRWIRIYICFLIPALIAGILFCFRQWIAASVFVSVMIFILLPLFIYSEEKFSEQRHSEIIGLLQKSAAASLPIKRTPVSSKIPPALEETAPVLSEKQTAAEETVSISSGELAARDRARILISQKKADAVRSRIDQIDRLLDADPRSVNDAEKAALLAEKDELTKYMLGIEHTTK